MKKTKVVVFLAIFTVIVIFIGIFIYQQRKVGESLDSLVPIKN